MAYSPYRERREGWLLRHVRLVVIVLAVCSAVLVAVKSWPS